VHKVLGPGLLETIYEKCLVQELKLQGFDVKRQQKIPVIYKGVELDCELRLDIIVNDCVVVELKAVEEMNALYVSQLLTYLKLLEKPKGLLINFNCENIASQLIPLVTKQFADLPKE
jgi:GxxExxY protein